MKQTVSSSNLANIEFARRVSSSKLCQVNQHDPPGLLSVATVLSNPQQLLQSARVEFEWRLWSHFRLSVTGSLQFPRKRTENDQKSACNARLDRGTRCQPSRESSSSISLRVTPRIASLPSTIHTDDEYHCTDKTSKNLKYLFVLLHIMFSEEQIYTTQAKSQWIVGQSPLSHLQYLDAFKSSTRDLSFQIISLLFSDKVTIFIKDCNRSPFEFEQENLPTCLLHVLSGMVKNTAYPAWIPTQRRSVVIQQMVASPHWLFSQRH